MEKQNEWYEKYLGNCGSYMCDESKDVVYVTDLPDLIAEAERRKERKVWSEINAWVKDEVATLNKKTDNYHVCPFFLDSFIDFTTSRLASLEE